MRTGNGQFRKFRFGHIFRYCLMFISSSFGYTDPEWCQHSGYPILFIVNYIWIIYF